MNEVNRDLNCRKVKQLTDSELIDINPEDVKAGMVVRMYEPDGTPISYLDKYYFLVESDAKQDVYGVIGFNFVTAIKQDYAEEMKNDN